MNGADVRTAAACCCDALAGLADRDWQAKVPDLGWTVRDTVAHIGDCLLWYTHDAAAGPEALETIEPRVTTDDPVALVATIRVHADVLAHVLDGLPGTARGFHPYGVADPSGFAAMACDELLVHTDDAVQALGAPGLAPDPDLCARTLARLFSRVEAGDDPWATLRWANGRLDLDGRPRRERWRWHSAPLDEG